MRSNRRDVVQFELAPLPYPADALAPHISARTVHHHYEKHHRGYLDTLENALQGSPEAELTLEQIILGSRGDVFNAAAQVWNHDFYWRSMAPEPSSPSGDLACRLDADFGGLDGWMKAFAAAAAGEFGSGWAWLAYLPEQQRLAVFSTTDAVCPLLTSARPLLTLDVWEHAYYLDYQQDRAAYIEAFVDRLANWEAAAERLVLAAG
jgi:superoxide dismutase, Fe-Mn family